MDLTRFVADLDPRSGAFLTPGFRIRDPGWVKNQDRIRDKHRISESLETIFWVKILKFFDADPEIFLTRIRDGKNSDPG